MKKQSLSISIPEPCHEKWSQMSPVEKGRHCKSCQKTVVDFTKMAKIQIAEYVSEHKGGMCGRFSSDQLNVELIPPKPTKSWLKYAALAMGLIPAMGYGQEVKPTPVSTETHIMNDLKTGEFIQERRVTKGKIAHHNKQNSTQTHIVNGVVLDLLYNDPLILGKVTLYKDDIMISSVETDFDGRFSIEVPEGAIIEASYLGYEPKQIDINDIDLSKELIIKLDGVILMGDLIVISTTPNNKEKEHIASEKAQITEEQIKKQNAIPEKDILHYQFPTVEFTDYKSPAIRVTTTGYFTTGIVYRENESWFKRQWKRFKKLVNNSYKASIKNSNNKQIEVLPNSLITNESSTIETDNNEDQISPSKMSDDIGIRVFPNPTSGYINISLPSHIENFKLNISDMNNQLVYSKMHSSDFNMMDFSSYLPGSYIISIIYEDKLVYSEMVVRM